MSPWSSPPPRPWRSGGWSLELRDDELAEIAFDGRPVLRAVRAVVRDRNWGTAALVVDRIDEADAALTLAVHSEGLGSSYAGIVSVEVAADELAVSCDLASAELFATNRTGLVALHPPRLAGTALSVTHSDGSLGHGAFPQEISPHQPVCDIAGLAWEHDGVEVEMELSGDVFEMEDQRNWTDASFKTYSRPLALPRPYDVAAGEHVVQRMVVRVRVVGPPSWSAGHHRLVLDRDGVYPQICLGASTAPDPSPALPSASGGLHVELDMESPNWRAALDRAAARGVPLDVRIVLPDDGLPDAPLTPAALTSLDVAVRALRRHPIARIAAFTGTGHITTAQTHAALRAAMAACDVRAPVMGGSRAHFTELNRAQHRVPADAEGIVFGSTPLVHTLSTEQLVESIAMQRLTATEARRIAGDRPVHVGPVTLRPRFNDVASGAVPRAIREDLAEGYGAALTGAVDERLWAPEAAAWLVASAAALAIRGVASITCFEEWGPLGIRSSSGDPRPVAAAIDAVAALSGGDLLWGESPDGLVWATGSALPGATVVLVANLDRRARTVSIETPLGTRAVNLQAGTWAREMLRAGGR